ncbi:MAG TPA: Gfo/Idh/MocA family oxidoreductase [Capsulimonadaceae bacterium]|jgi:predicted dehydrogenase
MKTLKVGIIGTGNISGAYLNSNKVFSVFDIVALADLDLDRARARAEEFSIGRVCTPSELLADPDIDIVINLTIPAAHYSVSVDILNAGKHVYLEKPLSVTREEGAALVALADAKGLRVGCAPDTFFGGSHQTVRKLVDDGWIGRPIAATAFMLCHGHESWHPAPEFYYKVGGGPMMDMGPYYLTALVNILGPIRRVTASATATFQERTITSTPLKGTKITVDTPTHIAGVMDFTSGAVGTLLTSFDVWSSEHRNIEIYGTEGTLIVPDPNGFGGEVKIKRAGAADWSVVPLTHGYTDNSRGIGVADMAYAIQSGRKHRASGELANHVLESMHGFLEASATDEHYRLKTTTERPAALPVGLTNGELDA